MKFVLRDYLENQRLHPLKETLLEIPKKCGAIGDFVWGGHEYHAPKWSVDVSGWSRRGERLELPSSVARALLREGKVGLVNTDPRDREGGPWDVFEIGPEAVRGYTPWQIYRPDPVIRNPVLEPT